MPFQSYLFCCLAKAILMPNWYGNISLHYSLKYRLFQVYKLKPSYNIASPIKNENLKDIIVACQVQWFFIYILDLPKYNQHILRVILISKFYLCDLFVGNNSNLIICAFKFLLK